eukprot:TRINITY_DN1627_c0_g1_i11.p1 TRINITY_DN1627_c0_g1~~TRINITY_DN1627_c0_g1_i11.p1  ORF type:complete len:739 (+),score=126.76 TRINITY_DN1627_c0_g1_i11:80-2296(+)
MGRRRIAGKNLAESAFTFDEDLPSDDDSSTSGSRSKSSSSQISAHIPSDAATGNESPPGEMDSIEITSVNMTGSTKAVGCGDFALLRLLGVGSFGKVFQVRKKDTGEIYAMKVLRKARVVRSRKGTRYLETERAILEGVRHPFIVSLQFAFQTDGKLYLVMQYLNGGELFYHLSQMQTFSEELTRFYAAEIVLAVMHLHGLGIVYRDLKPENLCLDADGHCVLTDFGLAKEALRDDEVSARSFCGTAEYMAPEIVTRQGHGRAVDWWSLGALIYEMMTGLPPFMSEGRKRDEKQITTKILKSDVMIPSKWSDPLKSLVSGLLAKDWRERLGSGPSDGLEIRAHPFFAAVDWAKLEQRLVPPPFKPVLAAGSADVSNFDPRFTQQTPVDSPIFLKFEEAKQLDVFGGFSYVAPNFMTPQRCRMTLVPNPSSFPGHNPENGSKMAENGPKMAENGPKMAENGENAPQMAENDPFSPVLPFPKPNMPHMFWHTASHEETGATGTSFLNRTEARLVLAAITHLLGKGVHPSTIGVITPYEAQRAHVVGLLARGDLAGKSAGIEIASVDAFQGREKDYIILSCVRSNQSMGIGFLNDPRRLNVSLTRAKFGFLAIGNAENLSKNSNLWHKLLTFYREKGVLIEGNFGNWAISRVFLPKMAISGQNGAKNTENGPKNAENGPKTAKNGAKNAKNGAKNAENAPKKLNSANLNSQNPELLSQMESQMDGSLGSQILEPMPFSQEF